MIEKKSPVDIKSKDDKKFLAVALPHSGTFRQELSHLFWRIKLPENYHPIYLGAQSTDIVTYLYSIGHYKSKLGLTSTKT